MKKNRRKRFVGPVIVILIILALAGFAGYNLIQVKHVEVRGNSQFGSDYIVNLANIEDETHMLKVDEKKIKENIESNPYLELESVDYKLPDTVILTVAERQPVCLIDYAGNILMLDRQLNVLSTDGQAETGKYPLLEGIVIDAVNLGKQIGASDSFKLSVATSILDGLKGEEIIGLITEIDLTDVNVIRMSTNGGPAILFGQSDLVEEKAGWIKKILPSMISEGKTTGTLDVTAGTFATYRLAQEIADPQATGTTPEATNTQTPESTNTQEPEPSNTQSVAPETTNSEE
jgi:hypothetical protein